MSEIHEGTVLSIGAGSRDEVLPENTYMGLYLPNDPENSDHRPDGKDTLSADEFLQYELHLRSKIGVRPGELIPGSRRLGGGNGRNIAVHTANLGYDTHLVSGVGDDEASKFIVADLQAHGIGTQFLAHRAGHVSSSAYIERLTGSGRHIRSLGRSALHLTVTKDHIADALQQTNPDIVVLSSAKSPIINRQTFELLATQAKQPFVTFLPGSSEFKDHPRELAEAMQLRKPDLFIGNETELAQFLRAVTGKEIDGQDFEKMAYLAGKYSLYAVCTAGRDGLFLSSRERFGKICLAQPALWAENPVDNTGAGDAAAALLTVHLSKIHDDNLVLHHTALEEAAKSGRDAVEHIGATGNVKPKFAA